MNKQEKLDSLGYCCINLTLPSQFKTCTMKNALNCKPSELYEKLESIYTHNLRELIRVIKWNVENQIWQYRISSDLFPLADHTDMEKHFHVFTENLELFKEVAEVLADYKSKGGRVSAHPSQFVVLSSASASTVRNSIRNLELHSTMFDLFKLDRSVESPLNIHISNGSKLKLARKNFRDNVQYVSPGVSSRLVLENEDKGGWKTEEVLEEAFPVTLDFHHWLCNHSDVELFELFEKCVSTWQPYKPVFHYSEGSAGLTDRTHSDTVQYIPPFFKGVSFNLELEAKAKEQAVLDLRKLIGHQTSSQIEWLDAIK